jgi:hypothetical protein
MNLNKNNNDNDRSKIEFNETNNFLLTILNKQILKKKISKLANENLELTLLSVILEH